MAGYYGYSKSNNAVAAEKENKFPITKAVKVLASQAQITQKRAREVLNKIGACEFHHTSKFYNETDYYDVNSAIYYLEMRPYAESLARLNFYEKIEPLFRLGDARFAALDSLYVEMAELIGCKKEDVQNIYYENWEK